MALPTRRRARRLAGATVAMALAAGSMAPLVGATTSDVDTSVLFAGPGIGVISAGNWKTGCDSVYLTTNFVGWRNVTPVVPAPAGPCLIDWTSASFVSPTIGWLLGRNGGSTATVLEETVDGGRHWMAREGGDTGSNGGWENIDFVNARIGWRQQVPIGANTDLLQRTTDGGASWSAVPGYSRSACFTTDQVWVNGSIGFAASALEGSSGAANLTRLWRTTDGGRTWAGASLPRPSTVPPRSVGLYGQPRFTGSTGTLPVVYGVNAHQDVYVYHSHDDGLSWTLDRTERASPVVVPPSLVVSRTSASQGCGADTGTVSGSLVSVDVAGPSTWMILRPGPAGHTEWITVHDGHVARFDALGLPSTTSGALVQAANGRDLFVTIPSTSSNATVWVSTDGAATFAALNPSVGAAGFTTPHHDPTRN